MSNTAAKTAVHGELLKLKQASAVLRVEPKELQNLVQLGVLTPTRSEKPWNGFDLPTLYQAKVAIHLKRALGTPYDRLRILLSEDELRWDELVEKRPSQLILRVTEGKEPLKIVLAFGKLALEVEEGLKRVALYRDLPRGRKRAGWKEEFFASLQQAAEQLDGISEQEIERDVQEYRSKLRRAKS